MRFVRAASAADLPPGGRLAVEVEGRAVALFNVGGTIHAIENRCGHQFMPLDDGALEGTRLACRWHGWTYELDPARAAACPFPRIDRFDVKVEGGEVYVGLSATPGTSPGASAQ